MPEKLKDRFFSEDSINHLADAIMAVYPRFDKPKFLGLIFDPEWEARELKDKMHHVTACLHETLPASFSDALAILTQIAPSIRGFDAMSLPDFVEQYGQDCWGLSLPALAYFTQFSSAEFAIRAFIIQDPDRAMVAMQRWAADENHHVRRLASEGCRPRLPWAQALPAFKQDPTRIFPVLERLKDDPSEYVRRSVANNLNDISKDHPDLVLDLCARWYGHSAETDWIVKHACRTLLKAGNRRAMSLFGFADPDDIRVENLALDSEVLKIGDEVRFSFDLILGTETARKLRLEYAVDFVKARGRLARKIFQIREGIFEPGCHRILRKHSFADLSTRTHHPGQHALTIVVNGSALGTIAFVLNDSSASR